MLVHMTPNEVQGLQKLALKHGGSLTINPKTGLPEAGFLSSILPALLGGAASLFGGGLGLSGLGLTALELGAGAAGGKATGQGWLSGALMGGAGAGIANSVVGAGMEPATTNARNMVMEDNAAAQEAAHAAAVQNASNMILQQNAAAVADPNAIMSPVSGPSAAWQNNPSVQNAIEQIDAPVTNVQWRPETYAAANAIPTSRGSAFNAGISNLVEGKTPLMPFLKSNSGKLLATFGPAILGAMGKGDQAPGPGPEGPFYNTAYKRKMIYGPGGQPIMVGGFTPGTWSSQYAGSGYHPVAGTNQTGNPTNPYGSASNPYTGIAANNPTPDPNSPYPTVYNPYTGQPVFGAKRGGAVRHYDEGGSTSPNRLPERTVMSKAIAPQSALEALHQKYANLLASPPPAPPDPTALNDYLAPLTAKPYDPNWKGPGNGGASAVNTTTNASSGSTGGARNPSAGNGIDRAPGSYYTGSGGGGGSSATFPPDTTQPPTDPNALNDIVPQGQMWTKPHPPQAPLGTRIINALKPANLANAAKNYGKEHPTGLMLANPGFGLANLAFNPGAYANFVNTVTHPVSTAMDTLKHGFGFLSTPDTPSGTNGIANVDPNATNMNTVDYLAGYRNIPLTDNTAPAGFDNGSGLPTGYADVTLSGPASNAEVGAAGTGGGGTFIDPLGEDATVNPNKKGGRIHRMAHGGLGSLGATYAAGGKLLRGDGDGMSDSIPAVITGHKPQRAALADGEFVVPADVVSHLGNGSTSAGAKKLYAMMDKIRLARTGNPKQGKQINPYKFLPA
jgi:hypothetical protein